MSGYVDADGHVIEDVSAIIRYLEPPFDKMRTVLNILPEGDKFHTPSGRIAKTPPGAFEPADSKKWTNFMDSTGTDWAVLYPTRAPLLWAHPLRRLGHRVCEGVQQLAARRLRERQPAPAGCWPASHAGCRRSCHRTPQVRPRPGHGRRHDPVQRLGEAHRLQRVLAAVRGS